MRNSVKAFKLESESEKQEKQNKLIKIGVILILCFLLLNFVLVLVVMNRTSKLSSSFSTTHFSAWANQTNETVQIVDKMKFELIGIENWINSTDEKFETHHFQIQSLSNKTKINKKLESLKNDNRELKKSHEKLKEQFQSLKQKLGQFENNISKSNQIQHVPLVTPPPEMTTTPAENKDQEPINPESITSCSVAMAILLSPRSKKQTIYLHGNNKSLEVLCDFEVDGGGWTIIQKISRGPKEEFNQNWSNYTEGFGSLGGNFWLGLDNIHALTKNGDQELRIELEDFEGEKRWAKYSNFSISNAADLYRLAISGFYSNSTVGDSMTDSSDHPNYIVNGMRFSTKDQEHDLSSGRICVVEFGGGGCGSRLNGLNFEKGETADTHKGIVWYSWKGGSYSLAKSEMKIRKRK